LQRERRGSQRRATRRQSGCAEPSTRHEQSGASAELRGKASTRQSPVSRRTSIQNLEGNHHTSSEPIAVHVGRADRVIRSEKLACPARRTASLGPVTTAQQAVPFSLVAEIANAVANLPAADAPIVLAAAILFDARRADRLHRSTQNNERNPRELLQFAWVGPTHPRPCVVHRRADASAGDADRVRLHAGEDPFTRAAKTPAVKVLTTKTLNQHYFHARYSARMPGCVQTGTIRPPPE